MHEMLRLKTSVIVLIIYYVQFISTEIQKHFMSGSGKRKKINFLENAAKNVFIIKYLIKNVYVELK